MPVNQSQHPPAIEASIPISPARSRLSRLAYARVGLGNEFVIPLRFAVVGWLGLMWFDQRGGGRARSLNDVPDSRPIIHFAGMDLLVPVSLSPYVVWILVIESLVGISVMCLLLWVSRLLAAHSVAASRAARLYALAQCGLNLSLVAIGFTSGIAICTRLGLSFLCLDDLVWKNTTLLVIGSAWPTLVLCVTQSRAARRFLDEPLPVNRLAVE